MYPLRIVPAKNTPFIDELFLYYFNDFVRTTVLEIFGWRLFICSYDMRLYKRDKSGNIDINILCTLETDITYLLKFWISLRKWAICNPSD